MRRFMIFCVMGGVWGLVMGLPAQAEFCEERERVCDQVGRTYEREFQRFEVNISGGFTDRGTLREETIFEINDFHLYDFFDLEYTVRLSPIREIVTSYVEVSYCLVIEDCDDYDNHIGLTKQYLIKGTIAEAKKRDRIGINETGTLRVRANQNLDALLSQKIEFYHLDEEGEQAYLQELRERFPRRDDSINRALVERRKAEFERYRNFRNEIRSGRNTGTFLFTFRTSSILHFKYDISGYTAIRNALAHREFTLPCAQETVTYDCKADDYINNCAALERVAGCSQLSSQCTRQDRDGQCGQYQDRYRCGNPLRRTRRGVQLLPTTHTISNERLEGCEDEEADALCRQTGRRCVEGRGTRNINGLDVTRGCWRFEKTYACLGDTTVDDCDSLEAAPECREERNTCLSSDDSGQCKHWEHRYTCGGTAAEGNPVARCGAQTYCIGGNCRSLDYAPNQDFALAVAWLNKLKSASEDFSGDPPSLFRGEEKSCRKEFLGFRNCCKDNGWGLSIGLVGCKLAEKKLAVAQSQGQTHYIGSYCATKIPLTGICVSKKQTYCQFKSRLARVFQEQIRAQLGIGWGGGKTPDCRSITIAELETVNWRRVNLSEVYQDLLSSVSAPDKATVNTAIQQRVKDHMTRARAKSPPVAPASSASGRSP